MDGNSPLGANGIPYVFKRFTRTGRITSDYGEFDESGAGTFTPQRSIHRRQLPMTLDVLDF